MYAAEIKSVKEEEGPKPRIAPPLRKEPEQALKITRKTETKPPILKAKMAIKAVIFDIQGVVVKVPPDAAYIDYLSRVSGKPQSYFAEPALTQNVNDFERGKISYDEFQDRASRLSGIPVPKLHWTAFYEGNISMNAGTVDLIHRLRKNHPKIRIIAFGNADRARFEVIRKMLPPDLFDATFLSCVIGETKPTLAAYRSVLEKLNIAPSEAIFTDDRQENIQGAKALGIHAFRFSDAAAFEKELSAMGLDIG